MMSLTGKERETLLILFKDFTNLYNANSISKILGISHVGAQKIFKRLSDNNIVESRTIGKSIIYKLKLEDDYVVKLIVFLLADEANNLKRWKEEFKALFKEDRIIIMYGSAVKNYAKARDIDIMAVIEKKEVNEINHILKEKEKVLPKNIHSIKLTNQDLLENLKKKDNVVIDIVKNAIVLHGQEMFVKVLKHVATI